MRTTDRFHFTPGMIVRMVADAVMIQVALIAALTLRWMFAAAFESQDFEPGALGDLRWRAMETARRHRERT